MEFPIEYKGYQIYEEIKTVKWHANVVSGHAWPETKATGKYRVAGGVMIDRVFTTIEKAKEHIDFYVKFFPAEYLNIP